MTIGVAINACDVLWLRKGNARTLQIKVVDR